MSGWAAVFGGIAAANRQEEAMRHLRMGNPLPSEQLELMCCFVNKKKGTAVHFTEIWKDDVERARISEDEILWEGEVMKFDHVYWQTKQGARINGTR